MALAAAATNEYLGRFILIYSWDFRLNLKFSGEKEHADIERERELYEYQHQQQQSPPPHQQTVHLSPTHPHLRHIGHPPSSLICIQPPQQQHQQHISNPSSQSSVQNHCTSSQNQLQNEHLHEMQIKKDSQALHLVQNPPAHYHSAPNGGESRPSVIESNQPMIIECT